MDFLHLISVIALVGVISIILYGMWGKRHDAALAARKMALAEAAAALQSLANTAGDAAAARQRDRLDNTESGKRAFYYQRATNIVASIPVDRL